MPKVCVIALAAEVLIVAAPAAAQKSKDTLRMGFYDPIPGVDLVYDPRAETSLTARAVDRQPKAIVRDPAANDCIELPIFDRDFFVDGPKREQIKDDGHPRTRSMLNFVFQAGQPAEV